MNTPGRKKGSARAADVPETPGFRGVPPEAAAWLRSRLGAGGALPFAAAVVAHLGRDPDAAPPADTARAVAALLEAPDAPGAAARLAADPPALASFFQNADLLFDHGFADADAVARLVLRALEILDAPA